MQAETGVRERMGVPVSMQRNNLVSGACWTGDLQNTEQTFPKSKV